MTTMKKVNEEFQQMYAGKAAELIGSEGKVKLLNGQEVHTKNLLEPDIELGTSVIVLKDKKSKEHYIYSADIKPAVR
jgi:hypothetical protein